MREAGTELGQDTRAGTGGLRGRWRAASLAAGWTVPGDWWVPAVDAVAEAVGDGRDAAASCTRLGRARAEAGVGLEEAFADLAALHGALDADGPRGLDAGAAHGPGPGGTGGPRGSGSARGAGAVPTEAPAGLVRALALGWTEVACTPGGAAGCEDPMTGLVTLPYLRTRLGEVYREAERLGMPPARTAAFVVTDPGEPVPVPGLPPDLARLGRELTVAESVRAVFSGGETLCGHGPSRVLALVGRGPDLGPRVTVLRRLLADRLPPADRPARVWVEGLPPTVDAAYRLTDEFGR